MKYCTLPSSRGKRAFNFLYYIQEYYLIRTGGAVLSEALSYFARKQAETNRYIVNVLNY